MGRERKRERERERERERGGGGEIYSDREATKEKDKIRNILKVSNTQR